MNERRLLELADDNFTQSLREHARWARGDVREDHGGIVLHGATDFPVGPYNALARVHEQRRADELVDWAHTRRVSGASRSTRAATPTRIWPPSARRGATASAAGCR